MVGICFTIYYNNTVLSLEGEFVITHSQIKLLFTATKNIIILQIWCCVCMFQRRSMFFITYADVH